jgi:hypothetical protein
MYRRLLKQRFFTWYTHGCNVVVDPAVPDEARLVPMPITVAKMITVTTIPATDSPSEAVPRALAAR